MVTDTEKLFYETFDIKPFRHCCKPRLDCHARSERTCKDTCEYYSSSTYPEINEQKILEILSIANKEGIYGYSDWGGSYLIGETVAELKENLLQDCIRNKYALREDIRKVFDGPWYSYSVRVVDSEGNPVSFPTKDTNYHVEVTLK